MLSPATCPRLKPPCSHRAQVIHSADQADQPSPLGRTRGTLYNCEVEIRGAVPKEASCRGRRNTRDKKPPLVLGGTVQRPQCCTGLYIPGKYHQRELTPGGEPECSAASLGTIRRTPDNKSEPEERSALYTTSRKYLSLKKWLPQS